MNGGGCRLLVRKLPSFLRPEDKESLLKFFGAVDVSVMSQNGAMVSDSRVYNLVLIILIREIVHLLHLQIQLMLEWYRSLANHVISHLSYYTHSGNDKTTPTECVWFSISCRLCITTVGKGRIS